MSDIEKARQKKRESTGWTLEEIKNSAQQERDVYKTLGECEPDGLASGKDMKKSWKKRLMKKMIKSLLLDNETQAKPVIREISREQAKP